MDPAQVDHRAHSFISEGPSDNDRSELSAAGPNTIITKAPEKRFRLGYWSVMGLVINRMIGTGIFNTPSTAMRGTRSVGITLLFWLCGAIYTLAGTHLHIEYGLTTPRYEFEGVEQGIPRSGGALNYLQYVFKKPAYRHKTVALSACVYGLTFILLGNMSGNCIVFAIRTFQAADIPASNGPVRGLAIGIATLACFVHAFSRRGGIWLGNLLAFIKVLILLLIIVTGICAYAGVFHTRARDTASDNLSTKHAFADAASDPYGYAQAFLAIIFAYAGFEQPNSVLSEIGRPRTKFPWGTSISVGIVCLLYMGVNLIYMIVVPRSVQIDSQYNVALEFFQETFGTLGNNKPQRILSAFMAISSLGNIIVMTFTAARIKQEIAKEGILPWSKIFGQSIDLSIGRFLNWCNRTPVIARPLYFILHFSWLDPKEHSQETPVGALFLHWLFTVVLILATVGQSPADAYSVLVSLYSYTIVAFFGFALAVGMLYLRFSPSSHWKDKSKGFVPFFSILSALVFGIGNLFPLIALWVPPSGNYARVTVAKVAWFATPVVGWSVIGFGALWWVGFIIIAKRKESKEGKIFTVEKFPEFERDPPSSGPPVQIHETVCLSWVGKENLPEFEVDYQLSRQASY
ncbi:amino acid transporter [Glonium stellatum]|uniref:Amino acid transporter n=1 Tax=Glonium stellatum TaxID=574774 RepID=A0A8E2F9J6_9PEZI|nr:amino acid transporter [Glonium stellatum]